eukprot:316022_1
MSVESCVKKWKCKLLCLGVSLLTILSMEIYAYQSNSNPFNRLPLDAFSKSSNHNLSAVNMNILQQNHSHYYFNIINKYKQTVMNITNDLIGVYIYKYPQNMVQNECNKHKINNKSNEYPLRTFNMAECKLNMSTYCTYSNALRLYKYPNYSDDKLHSDNEYKTQLNTIQSLTYLVISHHGGTDIDTISYLSNILQIPPTNMLNICSGVYCDVIETQNTVYKNYFSSEKTGLSGWNILLLEPLLQNCCWSKSYAYFSNISNINRIHSSIIKQNVTKIDIIVCSFPSSQCAFLLPFANIFIIRFHHRFDHHLTHVWENSIQNAVKWGQILHSMSHYCNNFILTASNSYDWFYAKHLLNIKTDSFYLWPNTARHFIDEFGENITKINANYSNIYIFSYNSFILRGTCLHILNVSNIMSELHKLHNVTLLTDDTMYKSYIYNKRKLHTELSGIVVLPYSVHEAKLIEYYSVGVQIFLPTLQLWTKLNNNCAYIKHLNAANLPNRNHDIYKHGFPKEWYNYFKHSPCCGTDPWSSDNRKYWLQFSEYYMNKDYFKYVIYFDNATDLIRQIIYYNDIELNDKLIRKGKQINDFTLLSKRVKPHLVNAIYNAYQQVLIAKSRNSTLCNVYVDQLTKCLIQQNNE